MTIPEPTPADLGRDAERAYALGLILFEERGSRTEPYGLPWIRRCNAAEQILRSLASYLGNGGYNADVVDPAQFEAKIRDGIDTIIRVETARREAAERERDELLWDFVDATAQAVHRVKVRQSHIPPLETTDE